MMKYKIKSTLFGILVFLSLALQQLSINKASVSLFKFFFDISYIRSLGISMLFIALVLLFLVFVLFNIIFSTLLKEPKFKLKNIALALSLPIVYAILLFGIWPLLNKDFHVAYGAYLSLILMACWCGLKLWLPISKNNTIQETTLDNEEIIQQDETLHLPDITEENNVSVQLVEANQEYETPVENDTFDDLTSASKVSLKQLCKAIFLINIALFTSFFLTWNSNISKDIGVVVFLSGHGLFDILSRLLLLFSLHILISNILFFTAPHYFLPASIINDIFYILMWLRGIDLVGFVNIAFAPLVGLALAIFSLVFMLHTIKKINTSQASTIKLKDDFINYFKSFFVLIKKIIHAFSLMISHWKNDIV